jgi:hypothetical protein
MEAAKIMVGTPDGDATSEDDSAGDPRDRGMKKCFDEKLLRKFIIFLGKVSSQM